MQSERSSISCSPAWPRWIERRFRCRPARTRPRARPRGGAPARSRAFERLPVFRGARRSVGGALPRGFAVMARRRTDPIVRVADARREQEASLVPGEEPRDALQSSRPGWQRYVAVVARRLARNFPGARLGADIVLASDLPR